MEELKNLISNLRWDTPPDQLENAKKEIKKISDHELIHLVQPIDKMYWDNAADLITEIGYPRVHGILSNLLEWIMDMNWPGAQKIAEFLVTIEAPIIPHIIEALKKGDHIWNYWIFENILSNLPQNLVMELKEDMMIIASGFDYDEAHMNALKLMVNKKIFDDNILLDLINIKLCDERNSDLLVELELLKTIVEG